MAKMFYSLDEAAERLGVSPDEVKQMAERGELQQYRDRDTLRFKRDQVDTLAAKASEDSAINLDSPTADETGAISLADTGELSFSEQTGDIDSPSKTGTMPLSDTGSLTLSDSTGSIPLADTDAGDQIGLEDTAGAQTGEITLSDTGILASEELSLSGTGELGESGLDLADSDAPTTASPPPTSRTRDQDPRQQTGISVFDADEIEPADPMAQTVVTGEVADQDLSLDSVGSGSGLLDLTREADDTSLGTELYDELMPQSGEASGMGTAAGSSGVFDGTVAVEPDASALETADDLAVLPGQAAGTGAMVGIGEGTVAGPLGTAVAYEPLSPGWSGATAGLFAGVLALLGVLAVVVISSSIFGTPSQITTLVTESTNNFYIGVGVAAGACLLLAVVGGLLGKVASR